MKKYCPYCHARLYQDENDYCFECGKKLNKVTYRKNFDHIIEPAKLKNGDPSKTKKTPLKDDTDWAAGLFVLFILYLVRVIFKYI